jgi:hypothetical protein
MQQARSLAPLRHTYSIPTHDYNDASWERIQDYNIHPHSRFLVGQVGGEYDIPVAYPLFPLVPNDI